jgi:carbamoyltransferase
LPVVVGIHALGHEAGACVARPEGIWAMSEERLSRIKYDPAFPERTIRWALKASGTGSPGEVDLVVYDLLEQAGHRVVESLKAMGFTGRILACRHHDAHAASAFFVSPFDRAAVLTIDAGGTRECESGPGVDPGEHCPGHPMHREVQARYSGRGNHLELIRRTVAGPPHSINPGVLYGLTSLFLGFGPMGSGKVMGLAAHGRPRPDFRSDLFEDLSGNALARCPSEEPLDESLIRTFLPGLFGGVQPRNPDQAIQDEHAAVAAHVQALTQREVISMARRLAEQTGERHLCLSGGYGLNAVTNACILEETPFEEIFVQPAATDAGIPLGCALWGLHQVLGTERRFEMKTAFLGGEYTDEQIESAVRNQTGLSATKRDDIEEFVARELADGKIVGWFRGQSEFGPRALGHRSILADPRTTLSVERLNRSIKFREAFRPYAPLVTEDAADTFFDIPAVSPFMLLIGRVRENWRPRLPAVTHVDGTARVQTVNRSQEPSLYRLLECFGKLSQVPVLLNTSFNQAGEPIVEAPADALAVLAATDLDAVALENFWVEKKSP